MTGGEEEWRKRCRPTTYFTSSTAMRSTGGGGDEEVEGKEEEEEEGGEEVEVEEGEEGEEERERQRQEGPNISRSHRSGRFHDLLIPSTAEAVKSDSLPFTQVTGLFPSQRAVDDSTAAVHAVLGVRRCPGTSRQRLDP